MAQRVARNNALSLANEANRLQGGVASMSLEDAENFAAAADKLDADLDYLEAATSAQASAQGPAVEDSPHVLKEVKNIKKKKATRKMKAKKKLAGVAAPEAAAQGEAALQEKPEPEAKATGQDKAEPEVTDVVCSFASLIVLPALIPPSIQVSRKVMPTTRVLRSTRSRSGFVVLRLIDQWRFSTPLHPGFSNDSGIQYIRVETS